MRCSWGQSLACRYEMSAKLLPRRIYDGDVISAPIGAGESHFYAVEIGAYDVVAVELIRRAP